MKRHHKGIKILRLFLLLGMAVLAMAGCGGASEKGVTEKLLEKGIKIRNCANFPGLGEGFYRVPVKLPEENRRLLDSIRECL